MSSVSFSDIERLEARQSRIRQLIKLISMLGEVGFDIRMSDDPFTVSPRRFNPRKPRNTRAESFNERYSLAALNLWDKMFTKDIASLRLQMRPAPIPASDSETMLGDPVLMASLDGNNSGS